MHQGVPFAFKSEKTKAFEAPKAVITKEPVLKKWCPELLTKVETIVSNGITGNMFSQ